MGIFRSELICNVLCVSKMLLYFCLYVPFFLRAHSADTPLTTVPLTSTQCCPMRLLNIKQTAWSNDAIDSKGLSRARRYWWHIRVKSCWRRPMVFTLMTPWFLCKPRTSMTWHRSQKYWVLYQP